MVMERDGDISKRKGETQQEEEEEHQEAKRLKGTIGPDAQQEEEQEEEEEAKRLKTTIEPDDFSCVGCTEPLAPPIFQVHLVRPSYSVVLIAKTVSMQVG